MSSVVERKTPGFAKGIMLFQTLVILLLSSWIYEEYLNNIYLQDYVNNTVAVDGALIALVVVVAALGVAFGLVKILRSTHKQIDALGSKPQDLTLAPNLPSSGPANTSSSVSKAGSNVDLHPMVAALKADLAHQGSMELIPPLEVRQVNPPPPTEAPPPASRPVPITGIPSTVITGNMPVLRRVSPDDQKPGSSQ